MFGTNISLEIRRVKELKHDRGNRLKANKKQIKSSYRLRNRDDKKGDSNTKSSESSRKNKKGLVEQKNTSVEGVKIDRKEGKNQKPLLN